MKNSQAKEITKLRELPFIFLAETSIDFKH